MAIVHELCRVEIDGYHCTLSAGHGGGHLTLRGTSSPSSSTQGEETWHFLDKRSKALANRDGLKLEFASHQDAELGRRVLEQREAEARAARLAVEALPTLRKLFEQIHQQPVYGGNVLRFRRMLDADTVLIKSEIGMKEVDKLLSAIDAMNQGPADHTAASTLRTALTEALADIEAGIKDDTLPPQYVLGLAYAMGRLTDPRIPALAALHTPTGAGTAEAAQ